MKLREKTIFSVAFVFLSIMMSTLFQNATLSVAPAACTKDAIKTILAPATLENSKVSVNCNLSLSPRDVITKVIYISGEESTGVSINCNGAQIDGRVLARMKYQNSGVVQKSSDVIFVNSTLVNNTWSRPSNVAFKNCNIFGKVRVYGLGKNGEAVLNKESSLSSGHTQRAQAAAPKNISFDHVKITTEGGTAIYFGPGVTYSSVKDSIFEGVLDSVAIYYDAESAYNNLSHNIFKVSTQAKRELVALDGSANNTISNNYFLGLKGIEKGGIYLYRNCGEGGSIRHQSPQGNSIVNNVFNYSSLSHKSKRPMIWVAARNSVRGNSHCDEDAGYNLGSSLSDLDYAQFNKMDGNLFYNSSRTKPQFDSRMIRNDDVNNKITNNSVVNSEPPAPSSHTFGPATTSTVQVNPSAPVAAKAPVTKVIDFECKAQANNSGCHKVQSCPAGMVVDSIKAACNLEKVALGNRVNDMPALLLSVVVESNEPSQGSCYVDEVKRSSIGNSSLHALKGRASFNLGCQEYDPNGGDCKIAGKVTCVSL